MVTAEPEEIEKQDEPENEQPLTEAERQKMFEAAKSAITRTS